MLTLPPIAEEILGAAAETWDAWFVSRKDSHVSGKLSMEQADFSPFLAHLLHLRVISRLVVGWVGAHCYWQFSLVAV